MRKAALGWWAANIAVTAVAVVAGYVIVVNHQSIQDWWSLRNYTPAEEIRQLADDTSMTPHARDLFYVSDPQIEDSTTFSQRCASVRGERSIVLGCYAARKIYLYNVTDPRLDGVKQVTAAHEMLHAAYERLDETTKNNVNGLLEQQAAAMNDERLRELIAMYERQEPGHRLNELHSILGTEYAQLSAELEQYYRRYFYDRQRVVDYANKYSALFTASQQRMRELQSQLEPMKASIDAQTAELNRQKALLDERGAYLQQLRQTDSDAYNREVPSYNQQAVQYNQMAAYTKQLVEKYNSLVAEYNNEAAAQSDLYHSLDSTYQPT